MPYITGDQRDSLEDPNVWGRGPVDAGELNYQITKVITDYVNRQGRRYQYINDVIGALEGAKLEFYRRFAAPYEDEKIKQNGDVY